jgi:hypothetical protein
MSQQSKKYYPVSIGNRKNITVLDDTDAVLQDALSILNSQILKFRIKVNKGQDLKLDETRMLCSMIKSLVEVSKETRERSKSDDLSNLTDAELLKLLEDKVNSHKVEEK